MYTIEAWCFKADPPTSRSQICCEGRVYGHPKYTDGETIRTSLVVGARDGSIETLGSTFILGSIDPEYKEWRERQGLPPIPQLYYDARTTPADVLEEGEIRDEPLRKPTGGRHNPESTPGLPRCCPLTGRDGIEATGSNPYLLGITPLGLRCGPSATDPSRSRGTGGINQYGTQLASVTTAQLNAARDEQRVKDRPTFKDGSNELTRMLKAYYSSWGHGPSVFMAMERKGALDMPQYRKLLGLEDGQTITGTQAFLLKGGTPLERRRALKAARQFKYHSAAIRFSENMIPVPRGVTAIGSE